MKKILIIRFSSIGDIVLTTPVIRCVKQQIPRCELHFISKEQYRNLLAPNPNIDKLYTFQKSVNEILKELRNEDYDFVLDLHQNIRSQILRFKLGKPFKAFNKLNIRKYLLVNFKMDRMPDVHIVERYLETASSLGVKNDNKGLDFFIPEKDEVKLSEQLPAAYQYGYIGLVIGAKFATKQLPHEKVVELLKEMNRPVVLLGGPEDAEKAEKIIADYQGEVFNSCGKFNLNQSASLVKQAELIISNDTGLMHIAAAFNKPIISVWGNTVPQLGMYPYLPQQQETSSNVFEIKNLKCRPCSKIGFQKCPKKHFDCMMQLDMKAVAKRVDEIL